jgi:hypothetical protein
LHCLPLCGFDENRKTATLQLMQRCACNREPGLECGQQMRGILLILTNIVNALAMSRFSLSQSFNLIGIKSFLTSLSQPELFIPNGIYDHVTKIPLLELKKLGIKGLIFDKDNTLTEPYKVSLNSDIEKFLRRANKVW